MSKQIDFLAIGDIVAEPFIKITEAKEECGESIGHCKLCLNLGGKVPYESAEICYATGNSSNASISLSRLGLKSYLVSYVGNDLIGKENIKTLKRNGVKTKYIQKVSGFKSNYHYVLWFNTERTILVNHTEFPYKLSSKIPEAKWVYLSSLASNSEQYHYEILNYLNKYPNTKLALQPGTFQIRLGIDKLKEIYSKAEIFFSNHEEAQRILNTKERDYIKLLKMIHDLGPKIVVITDGLNGACAYDGNDVWFIPVYPHTPLERTGAGDSFSSTFVAALINKKTIPEALMWGYVNAKSVVSFVGPHKGLLTREKLDQLVSEIQEDYKPRKLN